MVSEGQGSKGDYAQANWGKLLKGHTGPKRINKGDRLVGKPEPNLTAPLRALEGGIGPRRRMKDYRIMIDSLKYGTMTDEQASEFLVNIWDADQSNLVRGGSLGLDQIKLIVANLADSKMVTPNEAKKLVGLAIREDGEQRASNIWEETVSGVADYDPSVHNDSVIEKNKPIRPITPEEEKSELMRLIGSAGQRKIWVRKLMAQFGSSIGQSEAEDIVQGFVIKVIDKRDYFNNVDEMSNLLYVTLKNEAISYLRKIKRVSKYEKSSKDDEGEVVGSSDGKEDVNLDVGHSEVAEQIGSIILKYVRGEIAVGDKNFGHSARQAKNVGRWALVIESKCLGMGTMEIAHLLVLEDSDLRESYPLVYQYFNQEKFPGHEILFDRQRKDLNDTEKELIKIRNLIDQYYKRGMDLLCAELGISRQDAIVKSSNK